MTASPHYIENPHTPNDSTMAEYTHINNCRTASQLLSDILKRTQDAVIAALCLVIFSPLMLWCYFCIKREDSGPALFTQERIGLHGKPFKIYKFRSMRTDTEKNGPQLLQSMNDPRLTRIGNFLRKHHLDELPQLWNVLVGDMAFVGYRPERQFYIDKIVAVDPRYERLFAMRPGVTSYATLYNGYADNMEKMLRRLEYDLYYLDHHSWWFDIKILWNTFISIAFGKIF